MCFTPSRIRPHVSEPQPLLHRAAYEHPQPLLETSAAFLQKPFMSDARLGKLRELLEEPRASAA
jgi:hypothetical protein